MSITSALIRGTLGRSVVSKKDYYGRYIIIYIGAAFITSHHYNQQYFTIIGAASAAPTTPTCTALLGVITKFMQMV